MLVLITFYMNFCFDFTLYNTNMKNLVYNKVQINTTKATGLCG